MSDFPTPMSRNEAILQNMLGADNHLAPPMSREEALLQQILEQGGGGASSLSDLSDVDDTGVADGKVLKYNGTEEKWVPSIDEGQSTLAGLTDVNITSLSDNQFLRYDDLSNKWRNVTKSFKSVRQISGTTHPAPIDLFISDIINTDPGQAILMYSNNIYIGVGAKTSGNLNARKVYYARFYIDNNIPYMEIAEGSVNSTMVTLFSFTTIRLDRELPSVTSSDNGKVLTVASGEWSASTPEKELPSITESDNGKILGVSNGSWDKVDAPTELPAVSSSDNGKSLLVVNGVWDKANIYTELTGTLTAGQTSITIQNAIITANSTIDSIYVDIKGVKYIDMTIATGSVTLKFPTQNQDMGVKVRVS